MWRSRMVLVGLALIIGIIAGGAAQLPKKIFKRDWQSQLWPLRLDTARKVFEQKMEHLKAHHYVSPSEMYDWSEHWLDAELAVAANEPERLDAFMNHLGRTMQVQAGLQLLVKMEKAEQADADAANYYRIEAEIRRHKEADEQR